MSGLAPHDLLIADFGIRQLHARYIDAVWRKDDAAFGACFTDGARWQIAGLDMTGRETITGGFNTLIGPAVRVLMIASLPMLDIGAGTAKGRVQVTELVKRADGTAMRTIGTYDDAYEGTGTDWRFSARRWTLFYKGAPDLSDAMIT